MGRVRWSRALNVLLAAVCAALALEVWALSGRVEALERARAGEAGAGGRWQVVDYELASGAPPTATIEWVPAAPR